MKWQPKILASLIFCFGLGSTLVSTAKPSPELRRLQGEVKTLKVLQRLELSSEQLGQLRELALRANEFRNDFEQKMEGLEASARDELLAQREQALRGVLKSTSERPEVRRLREELNQQKREFLEKLKPVVQEAAGVLSEKQKAEVRDMFLARRSARSGPKRAMARVLGMVHRADESEYAEIREKIIKRHARILNEKGFSAAAVASESVRLAAALDEARSLNGRPFRRGLRAKYKRKMKKEFARWLTRESTLRALRALAGR